MTVRLGIAVGENAVRAVAVNGANVSWHATSPLSDVDAIRESLRTLLANRPRSRIDRRVTVAVGPAWVQTKRLLGVPTLPSTRLVNEVIRQNVRAFYLWKGRPLATTDVRVRKDGTMWGAAFDELLLTELVAAVKDAGLTLARVVPTVIAVSALSDGTTTWCDGNDAYTIESDRDGLRSLRRVPVDAISFSAMPRALERVGEDGGSFADAYAASTLRVATPLSWKPPRDARQRRVARATRTAAYASALAAAVAFALLAPGIRAIRAARASQAALRVIPHPADHGSTDEGELTRITKTLNRIETFSADRGRVTRLLGAISQALPESTAMLTIHLDSAEGTFTAVAPHVADVLPEVASLDQIVAPRIVGSVTKETLGPAQLERASFRFRRPKRVPSARKPGSAR